MVGSQKKTVLLTGGTGFIGRPLLAQLRTDGYEVLQFSDAGRKRDVRNKDAFSPFMGKGIDVVIHLAGRTFVPDSWNYPSEFYSVNTMGTQNVLDFCRETGAKHVYISAYLYGAPEYLPINEEHPVSPNNPYAHSKYLAEELCRFYSEHMGVNSIVFRPFNIYGIGQKDNFIIPLIIKQLVSENKIVVKDDRPKRDYVYLDDVVKAISKSVEYDSELVYLNIGSGVSYSVKEIIDKLVSLSNSGAIWSSTGETRHNEILDTVADCSKIKDTLDWAPQVGIEDGLKMVLDSYSL